MKQLLIQLVLCVAGLGMAGRVDARPIVIKMGSLAPEGSPWHHMLKQMGQDWNKISNGGITLRIYPGGVLGDEPSLVKKMRIGQLQAVGVSTVGLSLMDQGPLCLQVPLMFESYEEFDYVRDRMRPKLEARYENKGFIVLAWTDGGWIRFFTKKPVFTMEELRKQKLFVWAGDVGSAEIYTAAKFNPVPLAVTDMLPGLQTGLINALDAPPLAALLNQWFGLAPNMIDVKWAPLLGGVVMSQRAWRKFPAGQRGSLRQAARQASKQFSREIRTMSQDAIPAMQKRGLNVVKVDSAGYQNWKAEVEKIYPLFRKHMGGPALFDEVLKIRDEFRSR